MGIYKSIGSNKFKTRFLLIFFPVLLYGILYLILLLLSKNKEIALSNTNQIFIILGPIIIIRGIISLFCQKKIIFKYTGAQEITRKDNPRIYNIVENLCISKGIQPPKIGIIQDTSMNAFATGRSEKDSRIVFTTGLIDRLEDREIESVAGHELTHILNRDCRLMAIIVIYIGIISTLGQILIRSSSSSRNNKGNILPLIGIVLLILGYLFYPLMRLAISRKREYLADAGSVLLTKDSNAMISALKKISGDPIVESIQKDSVAAMCIENPLKKTKNFFSNLLATHPSIEDRIKALENY